MGEETNQVTLELVRMLKESQAATMQLLNEQMRENRRIVEELREENRQLRMKVESVVQKKPEPPIEKEILKRFNRNRKEIVMNKILQLHRTGNFGLPQLKDYVVDERRYCSKATFYRYIEIMKSQGLIKEEALLTQAVKG